MPEPNPGERWASGSAYEAYVGRWSRQVAVEFIRWLDAPVRARWLDVGTGTAALTSEALAKADPSSVVGLDQSLAFVGFTSLQELDTRAAFLAGDGTELPFADGVFDLAVSGLVLNFVPKPQRMVAGMARVVAEGGRVALYVWDYQGEMQMMRHFWDAVIELDSVARRYDEAMRFSICQPDQLRALFESAGVSSIETRNIDVETNFRDFDDYWTPFLGGTGTAPGYVASLDEEDRNALRQALRERLPVSADGSISLIARALAIRGTV